MNENKKQLIIWVYALVSIAIIIALILIFKKDKVEIEPVNNEEDSVLVVDEPKQVNKVISTKKAIISPEIDELNNISYTEAFMKYREGRLIQFAGNCQAHPYRMVLSNGSELMLDNRSENKEIISLGDTKHTLTPYGFKIIRLDVPEIPTTFLIDCAVSQNVNTLIIE